MFLKSIRLQNIRSYLNEEITFPDGSTLLSGDIGSGKSSILLAIEFALFGSRRKHLSGESLLRNGKKEGSVELKFLLEGKEIIIKRALKRAKDDVKQTSGYIIIDGKKQELMPSELKAKVLELFGYPREMVTRSKDIIYRYTVYTPQEEMKKILTDDEETRLNTLRQVFGIDKYKKIKENSAIFIRVLKEKISMNQGRVTDLEERKKDYSAKEKEVRETDIRISELNIRLRQFEEDTLLKKDKLKFFEEKINHLNKLENELSYNDALLKEKASSVSAMNSSQKENLEDIRKIKDKIDSFNVKDDKKAIEKELAEKESLLNEILQKKAVLREKKESLSSRKKELDDLLRSNVELSSLLIDKEAKLKQTEEIVNDKDEVMKNILKFEREINVLINEIKEQEIAIEDAKKVKEDISKLDKCPYCKQDVDDNHKEHIAILKDNVVRKLLPSLKLRKEEKKDTELLLNEVKKKLEQINRKEVEIAKLKVEIEQLREKTKDIVRKKKEHDELHEKLILITHDLEKVEKADADKLKKDIKELKDIFNRAYEKDNMLKLLEEKQKTNVKIEEDLKNTKKEIGRINLKKIELTKEIDKLKTTRKEYDDLREVFEKIQDDQKKLEIESAGLQKQKQGIVDIIKIFEKEIADKEKAKKEITKLKQYQTWFSEFFVNLMSVIERQVMLKVYSEFNELFITWFDTLIEDDNITVRLDENFSVIVEQNGYEVGIDNLSGGEKTSCALAYRLALNKVINDFVSSIKTKDLLILDEPTDGFSSEQLDRMRVILDELLAKQVIIVSHENKIESFVDNVIKIEKRGHVSNIA